MPVKNKMEVKMQILNKFKLNDEVCVITGANGRLGSYYCDLLSEQGAKIVALDISFSEQNLEKWDNSQNINPIICDISERDEVRKTFAKIREQFGDVTILINNAAAAQTTFVEGSLIEFENFPIEVWEANLRVNLTGAFLCCQEAGKQMLDVGRGVILNIGSTYGVVACDQRIYGKSGLNSNAAYATTKSGLVNFTRYLASYWQGQNIRVNCLIPGGVYNNQPDEFFENYINKTMIKRMAEPDDLGTAVLYLVSDASEWVTGAMHTVDGGFTAW